MSAWLDPRIAVAPSDRFHSFLRAVNDDGELNASIKEKLDDRRDLTLEDLRWVKEYIKARAISAAGGGDRAPPLFLHELLVADGGGGVRLPEVILPPRNPDLEARVQKLKAQQENRDYRRMTENVDRREEGGAMQTSKKEMRDLDRSWTVILQLVLSVVSAFVFGFFGPYLLYGSMDLGSRILCGIVAAFVVAVADLYFVLRFLLESEGQWIEGLNEKTAAAEKKTL